VRDDEARVDDIVEACDQIARHIAPDHVRYESLASDVLEMKRQEVTASMPRVDGVDVDPNPASVYASPYISFTWNHRHATLGGPGQAPVTLRVGGR
jgi:hypothetical protein